jgi:hypothetical protein
VLGRHYKKSTTCKRLTPAAQQFNHFIEIAQHKVSVCVLVQALAYHNNHRSVSEFETMSHLLNVHNFIK